MMRPATFSGVNHICVVTRDVDRTVRVWADRYNLGPWSVHTYDQSRVRAAVDGQPAEFGIRVGYCQFGPSTRIELIQPLDDRSPYAQSLDEHGDADHLHHLRLDVGDFASALDQLKGLGLRESLSAEFAGLDPSLRATAKYLTTEADLGFTVEVADVPSGFEQPPADYVYPAPDSTAAE
jgi:catechol 2,3-dioxygenase-like lactoylglutathione lyase family enzyme